MMTDEVLSYYRTFREAARAANVSEHTMYRWAKDKPIPEGLAARFDRITGGALSYDHKLYMSLRRKKP